MRVSITGFVAALAVAPSVHAAVFQASETLGSANRVDDPPSSGLARTLTLSTSATVIRDLSVSLDIGNATGDTAWNGDLYVQLVSPSGTQVVLVNRPGLSALDTTSGYGESGMNFTITDDAPSDVHSYKTVAYNLNGAGQVVGNWQSDGRTDPTGNTRSKKMDTLYGENPNGVWTLLIVDLANGSVAQLNGWSISGSDITAVPEPSSSLALGVILLSGAVALRSRRGRVSRN